MIPAWLTQVFPGEIRERGEAYVRSGRVRVDVADQQRIQAVVTGSARYAVTLKARKGSFKLSCNCPFAGDHRICKHLWAVIRTAEEYLLLPLVDVAGNTPMLEYEGVRTVVASAPAPRRTAPVEATASRIPEWKQSLQRIRQQSQHAGQTSTQPPLAVWPADRRLVYLIDLDTTAKSHGVVVDLGIESLRRDGSWSSAKRFTQGLEVWRAVPDPLDRHIAQMLLGAEGLYQAGAVRTTGFVIPPGVFDVALKPMLDSGRSRTRSATPRLDGRALRFDDTTPWTFRLRVTQHADSSFTVEGRLVRDDEEIALNAPDLLNPGGFLLMGDNLARFDARSWTPLLAELLRHGPMQVDSTIDQLLAELYAIPNVPDIELPPGTPVRESSAAPIRSVTITERTETWRATSTYDLHCHFDYGAMRVDPTSPGATCFDPRAMVVHRRHQELERRAIARLSALGARNEWNYRTNSSSLIVPKSKVTTLVAALLRDGWHVQADGIHFRAPGEIRASVRSGIDWFDLHGDIQYGSTEVSLSAVIDAWSKGHDTVVLADGSRGMLPVEWLTRLGPLAGSGQQSNGSTRFRKSQLMLVDLLLSSLPDVTVDEAFRKARASLARFEHIEPIDAAPTFRGTLRDYQRDGLGWFEFLREFGLGGCLADDMGLGKTVQVLAMLDARRKLRAGSSILVVPRSLVFNWIREAERFTPKLRVVDYSTMGRDANALDDAHLVITTYGTLRRDVAALGEHEFDYAILDEAQAIKNASTASAKACRLLRAKHRLALSGTPIENRIEELWSLLEFLNPGMLGQSAARFSQLANAAGGADDSDKEDVDEGRRQLARALRPVILRRTKEKVASELPERMEQTLEVELEAKQRKFYDGLRAQQHAKIMERVDLHGISKSKMHILEALLRLRQAACHPVLADASKAALPSAKLDALVPALASVTAEGHKALVFSQFTGFLALVRERLDEAGIRYEYLDGKTRDRQHVVDHFQQDADVPVFLISLKAGGHGLNLTSADYVYLLDPWWNPAVEAQAIDRAHRIGQTKRVIATRLVARNTIEEKILQLQANKRALADAILSGDQGVLSKIGRDELELLLG